MYNLIRCLMNKTFICLIISVSLICLFLSSCALSQSAELEVMNGSYPRAGYFRVAEFAIRNHYQHEQDGYEKWRDRFSDLEGIMGKTEYEELLRNNPHELIWTWFRKYKQEFPEKFVIVHLNGRGRIPNYKIDKFSAGHWLYFEGADILEDLPAVDAHNYSDEIWVKVSDPSHFRMDNGKNFKTPDDITLVQRNPDGTFDWERAEYVRLLDIDGDRIKIKRGMFGSQPLDFKSGQVYAAPHVMGGPWGGTANMVWYYNLSTECPKDKYGKTCADILVEELSSNFEQGGRWDIFDGVQFDVMTSVPTTGYHERRKALGQRADVNMDGEQDDGFINGVQTFGIGCFNYLTSLRNAIGSDKLILADGREVGCQKSGNNVLNGVEMEGVPEQRPYGFINWSSTYNILNHWKRTVMSPGFNYIAMRYNNPDMLSKEELFQYYRLAFAQSMFTDSFILVSSWTTLAGIPDLHELFGIEKNAKPTGWLGKPVSETEYPVAEIVDNFKVNLKAGNSEVRRLSDATWKIIPVRDESVQSFVLEQLPYENNQVCVEFKMRSSGVSDIYPDGYNRAFTITVNNCKKRFMQILGTMTDEWNTYRFYLANTYDYMTDTELVYNPNGEKYIDLEFEITDAYLPVEISDIEISLSPEIIKREFEKGVVYANLSAEPYVIDGITLPAKDAVFVRK